MSGQDAIPYRVSGQRLAQPEELKAELCDPAPVAGPELGVLTKEVLEENGKWLYPFVVCQNLFGGAQMRLPDIVFTFCAHVDGVQMR
jgi:hypothetical protein